MNAPDHIHWPAGLDAQGFLDEYWQKKPLLLRQAFPEFSTPVSPDDLAGMSLEEDTTPRLITQDGAGQYHLEHGPFDESRFGELDGNNWSLLVTDVEKHFPELSSYLIPFQFIPLWRIDDLMISYAPEGASVGAHVDAYDVFLLQASGARRWMIDSSNNPDLSYVPDATLKLLANFNANETFDLAPGDMLYLPPGVPHHGVAVSDHCTTWSIGFRAPELANLVQSFAEFAAQPLEGQLYRDPALRISTPGEIDQQSLDAFKRLWIDATQLSDADLAQMTGRVLTLPSIDVERDAFDEQDIDRFRWIKHPFSRFAFTNDNDVAILYADGNAMSCSLALAEALCSSKSVLANELNEQDHAVLQSLIDNGCVAPHDASRT